MSSWEASYIQRSLWAQRQAGVPAGVVARALRLSGQVDGGRLAEAVAEVAAAMDVLHTGFGPDGAVLAGNRPPAVHRARAGDDRRCAEILLRDRDRARDTARDPLVGFHLIECGRSETILGLVADPLVLDLRSVYLVLGAVMQSYFGRFRDREYPPFAKVAGVDPVGRPQVREARLGWWSGRLARWHAGAAPIGGAVGGRDIRAMELGMPEDRWTRLVRSSGREGNPGSLAVIALLTWWLRTEAPRGGRPPVFAGSLDLREYAGLGPMVGPLTDRIVFAVELDGFSNMSFRDLVLRAHAGLLDAVVHYVPYQDIVATGVSRGLLRPPDTARLWDIAVHYCRTPPASGNTRGDETLASRGLSIELFQESVLARGAPQSVGDGTSIEVQIAESGTGMALVVNFDARLTGEGEVAAMLAGMDALASKALADPGRALSSM